MIKEKTKIYRPQTLSKWLSWFLGIIFFNLLQVKTANIRNSVRNKMRPYLCLDRDGWTFVSLRSDKLLVCLKHIDDIFFIWTHRGKELHQFIEELNSHQPNIKFTCTFSKNCVPFLDLDVWLSQVELTTNLYVEPIDISIYILPHSTQTIPSAALYVVKHLE